MVLFPSQLKNCQIINPALVLIMENLQYWWNDSAQCFFLPVCPLTQNPSQNFPYFPISTIYKYESFKYFRICITTYLCGAYYDMLFEFGALFPPEILQMLLIPWNKSLCGNCGVNTERNFYGAPETLDKI